MRAERAADDGFGSPLVPGLKASADAARLAGELAFSTARLARLATDPEGVYAAIASEADIEEATWLAFLTAYLAPLEPVAEPSAAPFERFTGRGGRVASPPAGVASPPAGVVSPAAGVVSPAAGVVSPAAGVVSPAAGVVSPAAGIVSPADPFAGIRAVHTPWAAGTLPDLSEAALGPRSAHDPARGDRTPAAYRAWASRAGSQQAAFTGDPSWTPERRFARVFERLSLPGFHRAARFDLLTTLGRLGVYDVRADALHLGTGDDTELAAKRVFGIGDRALLERRAADLAEVAGVPIEALDLALYNWGRDPRPRVHAGVGATPDESAAERIRAELGIATTAPA